MAFTYILECADGSMYVGSTRDLERRVAEHNSDTDGAVYTRRRRPVRLLWAAEFEHVGAAYAFEKQVQGWSRRKREVLVAREWGLLPELASRAWRFRC
ncbi:MAG: GIY-YIG nuclease family protein [Nocardioides sp.]